MKNLFDYFKKDPEANFENGQSLTKPIANVTGLSSAS